MMVRQCHDFELEDLLFYIISIIDIRRYVELPVLQTWFIVFVPVLSLLLIVGGIVVRRPRYH